MKVLLKRLIGGVTGGSILSGLVRGVGGGIAAGLGWKIASDIYDGIRRKRAKEQPAKVVVEREDG